MSRTRHRVACLATIASLTLCFAAASESASAQQLEPQQQQQVEQLANQAYELHQQGKFAESIAIYLKAYEISKAADVLFNVATIYDRKLHERELAADYYRRYIRTPDPNPELVRRATERLTALKKEAEEENARRLAGPPLAAGAAAPATAAAKHGTTGPTPEEREESQRASRTWRTAGIIVGATGVAGVLASLALGLAAKTDNDAANRVCDGSSCRTQSGVDDASLAGTFATASTVTFIAGAALTAAGITMFFAAPKPLPSAAQLTIAPQVGTTGGGVTVAGSF